MTVAWSSICSTDGENIISPAPKQSCKPFSRGRVRCSAEYGRKQGPAVPRGAEQGWGSLWLTQGCSHPHRAPLVCLGTPSLPARAGCPASQAGRSPLPTGPQGPELPREGRMWLGFPSAVPFFDFLSIKEKGTECEAPRREKSRGISTGLYLCKALYCLYICCHAYRQAPQALAQLKVKCPKTKTVRAKVGR